MLNTIIAITNIILHYRNTSTGGFFNSKKKKNIVLIL